MSKNLVQSASNPFSTAFLKSKNKPVLFQKRAVVQFFFPNRMYSLNIGDSIMFCIVYYITATTKKKMLMRKNVLSILSKQSLLFLPTLFLVSSLNSSSSLCSLQSLAFLPDDSLCTHTQAAAFFAAQSSLGGVTDNGES